MSQITQKGRQSSVKASVAGIKQVKIRDDNVPLMITNSHHVDHVSGANRYLLCTCSRGYAGAAYN